jgi:hypothetical protein
MAKQLHIRIPQPCHENWNEMTPTSQGAFCKSCHKNVIDFSTKTENEIYNIISGAEDGKLCGRFTSFQLEQPIRKTEIINGWMNWRAIAASLAAFFSFGKLGTSADLEPKPKVVFTEKRIIGDTILPVIKEVPITVGKMMLAQEPGMKKEIVVKGQVINIETKEPIAYASVWLKGTKHGMLSDSFGNFEIKLDSAEIKNKSAELEVTYLGYEPAKISLAEFLSDKRNKIEVCPVKPAIKENEKIIDLAPVTLGVMVVTEYRHPIDQYDPEDLKVRYDPKLDIRKKVREKAKKQKN